MKTIMKIEIAFLVLVLLVAAGMVLTSEGGMNLFREPVIVEREIPPIPTEAPTPMPEVTEPVEAETPEKDSRDITAAKYFAYDIRKGEYLKKRGDGDERLYPASITKLLTSYVVLQHMDPDDVVMVGDALNLVQEGSSLADLKEGDKLTVEKLIAGMLLPSGNDAAQTVAVAVGRGIAGDSSLHYEKAVEVFVDEMNHQAQLLGMTNSHFANPDGFHHEDHYTTMDDLVVLCETVLADQTILKYTSQVTHGVSMPGRSLQWENTNILLHSDEDVYMPNAIGLKTGYTGKAGNCLISTFFMEDRLLLIGVFGCPAYTDDQYYDTLAIYNSI